MAFGTPSPVPTSLMRIVSSSDFDSIHENILFRSMADVPAENHFRSDFACFRAMCELSRSLLIRRTSSLRNPCIHRLTQDAVIYELTSDVETVQKGFNLNVRMLFMVWPKITLSVVGGSRDMNRYRICGKLVLHICFLR